MMSQSISKQFSFGQLLKFALPSIVMMIFLSLYTIVDGFFVSRFVGTDALSAVNIVYPVVSITVAIGIMFATGGSAIVAMRLGEGRQKTANENFTSIVIVATGASIVFCILSLLFMEPIVRLLGAQGALIPLSIQYLQILLIFAPMSVLQMLFQSFFVTAGKPTLGLALTVIAGICNMVLDYVLIVPVGLGIRGAALATAIGYCIPAIGGLVFFAQNRKGLCFVRPEFEFRMLINSCLNGSSEMITNLSNSVITLLFNVMMMKFAGSDGVAAITIILYTQFLMTSLFMGYSIGVAPIISYNYGADNKAYLKKLFRMCFLFVISASVVVFLTSFLSSGIIAGVFAPIGSSVYLLAVKGLRIFSFAFIFAGVNIFASALYTALSDGRISALISFSRTFLFTVVGIFLMVHFLQMDGLWLAIPFSELVTIIVVCFILRMKKPC